MANFLSLFKNSENHGCNLSELVGFRVLNLQKNIGICISYSLKIIL